MKLLTITVPAYNSEDYLERCIDSLLPGGEEVEILIVDDGSKDRTAEIADRYQEQYPTIVRAIHKENGGHGSGVNRGIWEAKAPFLKIVDSDDWVNEEAYHQILDFLRKVVQEHRALDLLISNYVHEKEGVKKKPVMQYKGQLPENEFFTWDGMHHMRVGHYVLMHACIYRVQMLRDCNLHLPEHLFYVDNIYVYFPIPHIRDMYYLPVNFYRYYIGRADQSVNETVQISRLDQQIAVNKMMFDYVSPLELEDRHHRQYMLSYLEIVTAVSTVLCIRSGTEENLARKKELWQYMKEKNPKLYHKLRYGTKLTPLLHAPGKLGRKGIVAIYKLATRIFGY